VPIKTNDSVMLFVQIFVAMLKINGHALIVIPKGKQVNGNNK